VDLEHDLVERRVSPESAIDLFDLRKQGRRLCANPMNWLTSLLAPLNFSSNLLVWAIVELE
jgi:hypothetical protein